MLKKRVANPIYRMYTLWAAVVAVTIYASLFYLSPLSLYVIWLIGLSSATFMLYGADKLEAARFGSQAQHRVPRALLHVLALLGGFAGGWLGMFVFWHKVRQGEFWLGLGLATLLHVGIGRFF